MITIIILSCYFFFKRGINVPGGGGRDFKGKNYAVMHD